ncbi:hypothetical protein [Nocardiopsis potens]|uniref:hypothetical protein n=1 Tax=Nocardiopsis potens TaxID=1246458 RepID=UPI00034CB5D1|nr:hypothetical protein [Nocardiopsis potens]
MGFDLSCVLTLDSDVPALFDVVIPGGSGHALRVGGPGWPRGWVLPSPWELEYGTGGALAVAQGALDVADPGAWRAAAGIPAAPDPLDAFDETDLRLASLLSLAAPVVLIEDSTFGGALSHEYAALCAGGVLRAACGVDFPNGRAFVLEAGAYREAPPAEVSPISDCARLLDRSFGTRSLLNGYLPREAHREGAPCREAWTEPAPSPAPEWRWHFPVLATG